MSFLLTPVVEFVVYGVAQTAGSKSIGRTRDGRAFVRPANPRVKDWMDAVRQAAGEAMRGRAMLRRGTGVGLRAAFYFARPASHFGARGALRPKAPRLHIKAPDMTKLVRAAEDAMRGIVYDDDGQVCWQLPTKHYAAADDPVRAELAIYRVESKGG